MHTSWLWHLHQPIYWPDRRVWGTDHYEAAWDTIQQQNGPRAHPPSDTLSQIFDVDDRIAAYQSRPHDAINNMFGYASAGAQLNYSGALMENIRSLGQANQYGYTPSWNSYNQQARSWTTAGGKPRMDILNFTFHHALAPFVSDETLEMELRIHQRQMQLYWGTTPAVSRGYFPAETCFSERMIPILKKVGIAWSVVANNHLARSCADFPLVVGSGGENCDLPNLADQLNPAQGLSNYKTLSIERGCSPTAAMPFSFQIHYTRYVDPNTGADSRIMIVPADQALGWRDSYGSWNVGLMSDLQARNNPSKPALALFAHDGDNAWSGGYSYYMEWLPTYTSQASGAGFELSTVEQFLLENPPDTNDVVHVEDGGWVFAAGDFGSPIFINWHWPPSYAGSGGANVVDPSLGVSDKADNWRVVVATENRVKTAQQISGITPNIDQVRDPGSFSTVPNAVELGWHYYLASLDSGFVYFGCSGDLCQRSTVAQSNAVRNVDSILAGNPNADTTPPTLFPPQRHPWNPGGTNFGVQYGYRTVVATNSDFWVWTYGYDFSGIASVSLNVRGNGNNPPTNDQCKTYAGGSLTGPWAVSNMTRRVAAPVTGASPSYIADYYYAKVSGLSNCFADYYVSATDNHGNTYKSPIQHVWIGTGQGGSSTVSATGCVGRACVSPSPPVQSLPATILYYPTGGPIASASSVYIHLGWNNWSTVASPDPAMTFNSASNRWEYTASVPANATQLDCDFNNGSGTWDNNGGSGVDYRFTVTTNSNTNPQPPAQPQNLAVTAAQTNQLTLAWSGASGATAYIVNRNNNPIALVSSTAYTDTGLTTNTTYCYYLVASNSVGFSTPSSTLCTNTPAPSTTYPPFTVNGTFAYPGYLLASNGMVLYGAIRGTTLYVATWSPGTNGPNDHFIFVSDQLMSSASAPAPWAKTGNIAVATTKPYLASESLNSYISWYTNGNQANLPCAKSITNSGSMAGTIDLVQVFGSMPPTLYLCAAAYITTNSGPIASACPPSPGPDIGTNGFFAIPTAALLDNDSDGTFDRLEPTGAFKLLSLPSPSGKPAMTWGAMPGHSYQVVTSPSPLGPWSNLPSAFTTAGPFQLNLAFTDAPTAAITQRFYKVKLIP